MTIKVIKECDNEWIVFNSKTGKSATIVKFNDSYGFIQKKSQYRVDVNGRTVGTLIDNFQTAKSIANKHTKKED